MKQVEECLTALGLDLQGSDAVARIFAVLHRAMEAAVDHFGRAARSGSGCMLA